MLTAILSMTLPYIKIYKVHAGIRIFGCLCVLLCVFSCAQLELPGLDDDNPSGESGATSGSSSVEADSLSSGKVLTVAEAIVATNLDEEVSVCGYYIGFVDGTSLSYENFMVGCEGTKANTNLLLSDDPLKVDPEDVFPVELTTSRGVRDSLNLHDHPELLKRRIIISGTLSKYFRVNGLKSVKAWRLVANDEVVEDQDSSDEESKDEGSNVTPDTPDLPDTPDQPDSPDTDDNTGTTGVGTGEETERLVFPSIVESRSANRAR